MLILDIVNDFCQSSSGLSVVLILKYGLIILQVAAPIILIVMLMVTFTKAITSGSGKEDALSKAFHEAGNKAIACIMVFLCSTAVLMLTNLIGATKFSDSLSCWGSDVTIEKINSMREAEKAKKKADAQAAIDAAKAKQELQDSSSGSTSGGTNVPWNGSVKNGEKVGNVVRYNQCVYGNYSTIDICQAGCGPVTLAMIASGLVDKSYDPVVVTKYLYDHGGINSSEGTSITSLNSIAGHFGLKGTKIFNIYEEKVDKTKEINALKNAVNSNKPVILGIPGHFIVLDKADNNKIHVINPAKMYCDNINQYYPCEGNYTAEEIYNATYNYRNRCSAENKCGWRTAYYYEKK